MIWDSREVRWPRPASWHSAVQDTRIRDAETEQQAHYTNQHALKHMLSTPLIYVAGYAQETALTTERQVEGVQLQRDRSVLWLCACLVSV